MKAKAFGLGLLIVSFLFAVAGIVEPSAGGSILVALFVFSGFAIITHQDHKDWVAGYGSGVADCSSTGKISSKSWDSHPHGAQTLYKCGQPNCTCVTDTRYLEWTQ